MELILLDWTRMGKSYCLAGAVSYRYGWKFVRPMLSVFRKSPLRNNGWPTKGRIARLCRWEIVKLSRPELADAQAPHLEDTWVSDLRGTGKLIGLETRREILQSGLREEGQPLFGEHLSGTKTAAYLKPGTGKRSLATMIFETGQISFRGMARRNQESDIRVSFDVPGLHGRSVPVKDHWLLLRAEQAGGDLNEQLQALESMIRQMGDRVAVRLGLSREFAPGDDEPGKGFCWLMADGFFSLDNPQP